MASHWGKLFYRNFEWEAYYEYKLSNCSHIVPQYPKLVRNIDVNGLLTIFICYNIRKV